MSNCRISLLNKIPHYTAMLLLVAYKKRLFAFIDLYI